MCPFVGFLQPGVAHYAHGTGYEKYFGGAERQITHLAGELSSRGYTTGIIIYGKERGIFLKDNIMWISGPLPPHESDLLDRIKNLWRVEYSIHLMSPDVLIQRGTDVHTLVAARYCKKNDIPFVVSISHDLEFSQRIKNDISLRAAKIGLRMASAVIIQHEGQRKILPNFEGRVEIIPNMVKIPENIQRSEEPRIFWIGQPRRWKVPEKFVELARRHPEYEFIMYAHGFKSPHISNLTLMDFDINASENLRHGDVLVLTSWGEGMSNVILEAWSRGTAVLSLHTDPAGMIERSGGGLVGENLEKVIEKRYEMGRNGRKYVVEHHRPEVIVKKWESILNGLLS